MLENIKWWFKYNIKIPVILFIHGLKNLWKWRKVIYKQTDVDYYYVYELLEFKLECMVKRFSVDNPYEDGEIKIALMKELIEIIKNLKTDFLCIENIDNYITEEEFNQFLIENPNFNNPDMEQSYKEVACIRKYKKILFNKLEKELHSLYC